MLEYGAEQIKVERSAEDHADTDELAALRALPAGLPEIPAEAPDVPQDVDGISPRLKQEPLMLAATPDRSATRSGGRDDRNQREVGMT